MKFADVDGNKTEATNGARGFCRICGSELGAKCGEVYVHHWAHKGKRNCDPWWENETEWHRAWKEYFPVDWQEVIQFAGNGEKHIADVKTESDWVLEFQHSYLKPEERRSRNAFYPKLAWVVDGTRRKTDVPQFDKAIKESTFVLKEPPILRISFPEECRLLREWHDSNALVFFDFQGTQNTNQPMLWFLFPKIVDNEAYLSPFSRQKFIEMQNGKEFDEFVRDVILPYRTELAKGIQIRRKNIKYAHSTRASGFTRQMANKRRRQRRL